MLSILAGTYLTIIVFDLKSLDAAIGPLARLFLGEYVIADAMSNEAPSQILREPTLFGNLSICCGAIERDMVNHSVRVDYPQGSDMSCLSKPSVFHLSRIEED